MSPSISVREHIRWLPDDPAEPTTTLVLTSAENRFVDVRVLKPPQHHPLEHFKGDLPIARLDWAFAGTSATSSRQDKSGKSITHSQWRHWVDSRHPNAEEVTDEGDMYPQPDGKTLEKGSMVNPATGDMSEYEELWSDIEPKPVLSQTTGQRKRICAVLVLGDDANKARGIVIRVGQYAQGVLRVAEEIDVERWEWEEGGERGWRRAVKIGRLFQPCSAVMREEGLKLGGEVKWGEGWVWKCVELADF